jgi:hypothetical protein
VSCKRQARCARRTNEWRLPGREIDFVSADLGARVTGLHAMELGDERLRVGAVTELSLILVYIAS